MLTGPALLLAPSAAIASLPRLWFGPSCCSSVARPAADSAFHLSLASEMARRVAANTSSGCLARSPKSLIAGLSSGVGVSLDSFSFLVAPCPQFCANFLYEPVHLSSVS